MLFSFTQWVSAFSYTVEISKQIIEEQISLHMPLEKHIPLVSLRLYEPKVNLFAESNEVSLFVNVDVVMLKGFKGTGRGELIGTIDYRPDEGAFYLINPRVVNLNIDRVPPVIVPKITQAATLLLTKSLETYPVYRLNEEDTRQKMAKASLKKVEVADEKLLLTFGLPN